MRRCGTSTLRCSQRRRGPWRTVDGPRSGTKPTQITKDKKLFVIFVLFVAFVPERETVASASQLGFRSFLGRRDPLLHECVPFMAVRALPEELGAAVAALQADVRIEVEDRVAREIDVARDQGGR